MDNFFLYPNEHQAVFHHGGWDFEVLLEVFDRDFVLLFRGLWLALFLLGERAVLLLEGIHPWRVDEDGLDVIGMV